MTKIINTEEVSKEMATREQLKQRAKENHKNRTFQFKQSDKSKRDLHLLVHFIIEHDIKIDQPKNGYFDRIGFDLKSFFGEEDLEISILQDILKVEPWNEDGTFDERQLAYAKWLYNSEFTKWFASNAVAMIRKWLHRPTAIIRKKIKPGGSSKKVTNNRLKNVDWM